MSLGRSQSQCDSGLEVRDVLRFLDRIEISTPGRRVRVRPPRNDYIRDTFQNCFTLLIAQEVSIANDSTVGSRLRLTHLQNSHFEIELITWAYRIRQSQVIPTQSQEDLEVR